MALELELELEPLPPQPFSKAKHAPAMKKDRIVLEGGVICITLNQTALRPNIEESVLI
ncbi:hypothetical protein [Hyphococcus sp.]|uniref:hypothetical protein n=1 Tax=Hyphococcus sp. TaxID=2038636 RepID=UPI0020894D4E|nr:MAG: hypothetical protein DHS20C04_02100 [Marinicaulis sp.]